MTADSNAKYQAIERGRTVILSDAELLELLKWSPPYATLTVNRHGTNRNAVSGSTEDYE